MTELHDHDRPLNSLESAFTAELGEKDEGATLPYCSNLSRKETLVAIPRVVQYLLIHIYHRSNDQGFQVSIPPTFEPTGRAIP